MPEPLYQQGIPRAWWKEDKYDFYMPEFQNLSDEAVYQAELFVTDGNSSENTTIFGYQGRYNYMRSRQNIVVGKMRDTFDYWHMSRQFAAAPTLNNEFLACQPRMDAFADTEEDPCMVHIGNNVKAVRPMQIAGVPGGLDHI